MDIDEHTGGSKQERKEAQEWFDRDLKKKPILRKTMGKDYDKFFVTK